MNTLYPFTKEELEEMHKIFDDGLKEGRKIKKKNGKNITKGTQPKDN